MGHFYTKNSMYDCCILIHKKQYEDSKRIVLKISWFLKKSMTPMGITETVTIQKGDIKDWFEIL